MKEKLNKLLLIFDVIEGFLLRYKTIIFLVCFYLFLSTLKDIAPYDFSGEIAGIKFALDNLVTTIERK